MCCFFIFLNNLLGLIPFFPGGANLTGNIAVPMVMASMVFIITTLSGKKHYWQHIFMMPGVPKPVLLILTPIEIMGVFLKPLVLMIRFFLITKKGQRGYFLPDLVVLLPGAGLVFFGFNLSGSLGPG